MNEMNACRLCQRRSEAAVCDGCVERTMKLIAQRRGLGAVWRFDLPDECHVLLLPLVSCPPRAKWD